MSEVNDSRLRISETFSSIQGEGDTVGIPAVFLRLTGCGHGCVWCDTTEVWKTGTWYTLPEVDKLFDTENYYAQLRKGAHLVLTGGDPMLQQGALVAMFELFKTYGREPERMFVEVETQGAISATPELHRWVRHWNVSPKLKNSGVPDSKRLNLEVLRQHVQHNACFKFPVGTLDDVKEVEELVRQLGIWRTRVMLMPVCHTRETFMELAPKVAEWCKKSGFRFSPRLQLVLWDKATGC